MKTLDEKISWGIQTLERYAPKGWRSILHKNFANIRFGSGEASIPAVIFGSLQIARTSIPTIRFVGELQANGFLSDNQSSPNELRNKWTEVLASDKTWAKLSNSYYTKKILGKRISVYRVGLDNWMVSGYSTIYKNIESAKRSVRKLSKEI